jgi:Ribbon-helix-helix protein, copG family
MYGMMYGMVKTTVYLPESLKLRLASVARQEGCSEAELVRAALEHYTAEHVRPHPRFPLIEGERVPPDLAERDEEYLEGFGKD